MIADVVTVRGSVTQASLSVMQDLIDRWSKHPLFVRLSREIAAAAGAKNYFEECKAIWAWIRSTVQYRADPVDTQWIQDPFETAITSKAGNCANMTVVAGTLLQALGHPCKATAVKWSDRDTFTHAVCVDNRVGAVCDPVSPTFEWPPYGRSVDAMMGAL